MIVRISFRDDDDSRQWRDQKERNVQTTTNTTTYIHQDLQHQDQEGASPRVSYLSTTFLRRFACIVASIIHDGGRNGRGRGSLSGQFASAIFRFTLSPSIDWHEAGRILIPFFFLSYPGESGYWSSLEDINDMMGRIPPSPGWAGIGRVEVVSSRDAVGNGLLIWCGYDEGWDGLAGVVDVCLCVCIFWVAGFGLVLEREHPRRIDTPTPHRSFSQLVFMNWKEGIDG
jgi:hypothetical protein